MLHHGAIISRVGVDLQILLLAYANMGRQRNG